MRILEVQKLPEDIKEKVFYMIDVSIKDHKTRQAVRFLTSESFESDSEKEKGGARFALAR
ncbi:MAG: hypothetical protein AAF843_21040 [Bacteroidota bacterium]